MSQADLAKAAGMRSNQISRYERSEVLPQLAQLDRILTALGVGMSELLATIAHVERIHAVVEGVDRPEPETLALQAVRAYADDAMDFHLALSRKVAAVVQEHYGSGAREHAPGER